MAFGATATLPWLLIFSTPPVPSLYNEISAWIGWIAIAAWLLWSLRSSSFIVPRSAIAVPAAIALLAVAALTRTVMGQVLYPGVTVGYLAYLGAALFIYMAGAAASGLAPTMAEAVLDRFSVALLAGALISVGLCAMQYVHAGEELPFLAKVSSPGRMFGNLRQPNHLATVICMAQVAVVWLLVRERIRLAPASAAASCLAFGLAMTGSRTGMLAAVVASLAVCLAGRGRVRAIALLNGLLPFVAWIGLSAAAVYGPYEFFGSARLQTMGSDYTGSRWPAWVNTAEMIAGAPLWGVGLGRYAFHYMMGEWSYPADLPFFNAHNLVLHLAAENGLPIASFVIGVLSWTLLRPLRAGFKTPLVWGATSFILPILVHSMFEFPLWFSYFLLPTGFFVGVLAGGLRPPVAVVRVRPSIWVGALSALLLAPGYAAWAQWVGEPMYWPQSRHLALRIQDAQASFLFRQHADNALMTLGIDEITQSNGAEPVFRALLQTLPNYKLMIRYAELLARRDQPLPAARLLYQAMLIMPRNELAALQDSLRQTALKDAQIAAVVSLLERLPRPSLPLQYWLEVPAVAQP